MDGLEESIALNTSVPKSQANSYISWSGIVPKPSNDIDEKCDETLELVSWIINGFLGILIFLGNSFVFLVFLHSKRLCRVYMNMFLLSLALCDLSMAVFVVPGYAAFCTGCSYPLTDLCWLFEGGKDVCFLASVFSLLAITYDRYLAVFRPLNYQVKMTQAKVYGIVLTSWLLPVVLASVRNAWQHNGRTSEIEIWNVTYSNILLFVFIFCPIITVTFVNIKIIFAIRNQRRLYICRAEPSELASANTVINSLKEAVRSRKGTMSCALVVVVFIVCWIPRACYFIFHLSHRTDLITPLLSKLSVSFLFFQSSINPLIYSFYRAEFRIAAKKLIACLVRKLCWNAGRC